MFVPWVVPFKLAFGFTGIKKEVIKVDSFTSTSIGL